MRKNANALVLFLISERELFKDVRRHLNAKSKKTHGEVFQQAINGVNYLIAATRRENFSFEKHASKFHDAFKYIAYMERVLDESGVRYVEDINTVKTVSGIEPNNALTQYLENIGCICDSVLEGLEKEDNPSYYLLFEDAFEAIADLHTAADETKYTMDFRSQYVEDLIFIGRVVDEFIHYETMQKVEECFDMILGQNK